MLWACLGPVTEVTAVAGKADVTHLVLRHETGVTSTVTTTQSAPEAAAGVTVFVWGEAGRSVMPADLVDSVAALRTAAAELIAVRRGRAAVTHPCDVRFGRDITRVLAEAEAQLSGCAAEGQNEGYRRTSALSGNSQRGTVPTCACPPRLG